jgi:hypothetical protein
MRHAVLLLAALTAGACARRLPPDRSAAALYRDLERLVTVAETTGWDIDRKEVEGLESEALDSLCRVDPLARRNLREWLDAETAAAGGPVEAAWRAAVAAGRDRDILRLHRIGLVLDDAERIAAVDCPFWLEPGPFRGSRSPTPLAAASSGGRVVVRAATAAICRAAAPAGCCWAKPDRARRCTPASSWAPPRRSPRTRWATAPAWCWASTS